MKKTIQGIVLGSAFVGILLAFYFTIKADFESTVASILIALTFSVVNLYLDKME